MKKRGMNKKKMNFLILNKFFLQMMANVDDADRFNQILKTREQIIDRIIYRIDKLQTLVDERFAIQERMRIIHSRRFIKLCLYRIKVLKFLIGRSVTTGVTTGVTTDNVADVVPDEFSIVFESSRECEEYLNKDNIDEGESIFESMVDFILDGFKYFIAFVIIAGYVSFAIKN